MDCSPSDTGKRAKEQPNPQLRSFGICAPWYPQIRLDCSFEGWRNQTLYRQRCDRTGFESLHRFHVESKVTLNSEKLPTPVPGVVGSLYRASRRVHAKILPLQQSTSSGSRKSVVLLCGFREHRARCGLSDSPGSSGCRA